MRQQRLKIENLSCIESQLREFILPILRGNVFHVTNRAGFKGITKDRLIRSNKQGEFPYSYPQSDRSYARTRGYVSLFDLKTISDDELENALRKFYFLNPSFTENNPIFLILSRSIYSTLIPWTRARDEHAWKEMFIPHVESFHQGDISVSCISRVVSVKIKRARHRSTSLYRTMERAFIEIPVQPDRTS